MKDISKRFVVMYNGWPVASADERREAESDMRRMRDAQAESLQGFFPLRMIDNRSLWLVSDMGTDAPQQVRRTGS